MISSAFFIYYIKNYYILQDTPFLSTFVKKVNFITWFEHEKLDLRYNAIMRKFQDGGPVAL